MNYYRNERGFPFLLPFLAGAVIGPLFVNGFGYNNNCRYPNCGYPYQPPMYGPIINNPNTPVFMQNPTFVEPYPNYVPYM